MEEKIFIWYGVAGLITLVIIFILTAIAIEKNNKALARQEYTKIAVGDIYECKNDVNSKGMSSTNPFLQNRYQVIRKKDGWVELKSLDNGSIHQIPVKELIEKNYKCINNIR